MSIIPGVAVQFEYSYNITYSDNKAKFRVFRGRAFLEVTNLMYKGVVLMYKGVVRFVIMAATVGVYCPMPSRAQDAPPAMASLAHPVDHCAELAALSLDHVELTAATSEGSEAAPAGTPGSLAARMAALPGFCRITGRMHPEAGSDIGVEVWMPLANWDGRLHGAGNGGFAGYVSYADLGAAVRAGAVGVATDTGHYAAMIDASWAKAHPERIRDYGWRAIHLSALLAKQLIVKMYGRPADHAYFMACSGGGRQGLVEAERFPDDYDGIVASAPASIFTDMALTMINTVQAQTAPGAAIRSNQVPFLQAEVLRQCDALDGQMDGLVADPRQCHLDVSKLECATSDSPQCFTPPQVEALRKIYAGPRNSSGRQLAPAFPASGGEHGTAGSSGWELWVLGDGKRRPNQSFLPDGILANFIAEPFASTDTFDFDKDTARLRALLAPDIDAKPDLTRFFKRGGKLIMWHGWADPAIAPQLSINFHESILRASGYRAKGSVRLFMVPGVQHCFGGPGPNMFGQIVAPMPGASPESSLGAAIHAWVESGLAPDKIIAHTGSITEFAGAPPNGPEENRRLICAYPARATLRSNGDTTNVLSYQCL